MKKLFYLLLLPLSLLISCDDNEKFSPVDMTLTLSGVTEAGNLFYTVRGETVIIDDLSVTAVDGKNSGARNLMFYLNGVPVFPSAFDADEMITPVDPLRYAFTTDNLAPGNYVLSVAGTLLQVESPIYSFAIDYNLCVEESVEDLPEGAPEIGTYSRTVRFNPSK